MGRTRTTSRGARARRRPGLESLEARLLLSRGGASPAPSGAFVNGDGTVAFDSIIGASAARARFGVDGSGQSVAVIDTGVDYKNAMLGGAVGKGRPVLDGVDFTGSPNGVLPTWQHGTGVAGLLASPTIGVAPKASIVPLRVFGDNNQGSFDNIARALEWVAQHHSQSNITAVNLSVSDGGNYLSDFFARDGGVGQRITDDVKALDGLNIPVVIASGNSFDGKAQGQGFASVIPDAISVTATDESKGNASATSDRLASNAQRLGTAKGGVSATKIAAPGVGIVAPSGDNGTATEDGTSFATPQVTGTIVLLQQMYEAAYHRLPSVATLTQLLQDGAAPIHDGVTGISIGRLDTLRSLTLLDDQIHPTPAPGKVGGDSGSKSVAAMSGNATAPSVTANPSVAKVAPDSSAARQEAAPDSSGGSKAPAEVVSMTEVFLNGDSIGSYPTSRLARKYSAILKFEKGPTKTLRIWAAKGSTVDLGASVPSGTMAARHPAHPPARQAIAKAVGNKPGAAHSATAAASSVSLGNHAAPKKHRSILPFGIPFPF